MKHKSDQSCLMIVDMINGFVKEGPLADPAICSIIKPIEQIIKDFKQNNNPIVAFCDAHEPSAQEFKVFPIHCVKKTPESDIIDEYQPYMADTKVFYKNSVNSFFAPGFETWLKKQPLYKEYIVTGCVTDICVFQLAASLIAYFHQHNLDTEVIVTKDTSETFEIEGHPRESYNFMAYTLLNQLGVKVLEHYESTHD